MAIQPQSEKINITFWRYFRIGAGRGSLRGLRDEWDTLK
jgi:hypothetical protein